MKNLSLFGTSGIRGDENKLFNNQFCYDIGRTFAVFVKNYGKQKRICVGNDPRGSSPRIAYFVSVGLVDQGYQVVRQGISPVAAINLLTQNCNYLAGVMITGSHIAKGLNGIKFFLKGEEILKNHEQEIDSIYQQLKNKQQVKAKSVKDSFSISNEATDNYEEHLVKLSNQKGNLKIVVDPGNGSQSDVFGRVLKRLGYRITLINDNLQGGFISRDTEVHDSFSQLQNSVLKTRSDLGIGFDCDGDRVIFIDKKGGFVNGDYSGTVLTKYLGEKSVVVPVNVSQVIDNIGIKVYRTKVGSPYVIESMKINKVDFGFESNGGCIWGKFMLTRDGGTTAILMLNLLNQTRKDLSDLINTLPKYYLWRDKTDCPFNKKDQVIKQVISFYKNYHYRVENLDGLKIWLNKHEWVFYRQSHNAPEFRVFAETNDVNKSKRLVKEGIDLVKNRLSS